MSISSAAGGRAHKRVRRVPPSLVALTSLLALLFVGALQGGIAMVMNPVNPLGMSPSYLGAAPSAPTSGPACSFSGSLPPQHLRSLACSLDGNGVGRLRSKACVGYRWPWLASLSIGTVLLAFELIELVMVPFHPVMHPLLIGWSAAIIGLPLTHLLAAISE